MGGAVVVGASMLVFGAQAWAGSFTNLSVMTDEKSLSCMPIMSCFDVTSDKNITHIFVEIEACTVQESDPFMITVDGVPVTKVHTNGGPCNHGPDAPMSVPENDEVLDLNGPFLIDKPRIWFPLPGNQSTARVCVSVDEPSMIEVGAKSADDCAQNTASLCQCMPGNCP
jgi:hypothetical protein